MVKKEFKDVDSITEGSVEFPCIIGCILESNPHNLISRYNSGSWGVESWETLSKVILPILKQDAFLKHEGCTLMVHEYTEDEYVQKVLLEGGLTLTNHTCAPATEEEIRDYYKELKQATPQP